VQIPWVEGGIQGEVKKKFWPIKPRPRKGRQTGTNKNKNLPVRQHVLVKSQVSSRQFGQNHVVTGESWESEENTRNTLD